VASEEQRAYQIQIHPHELQLHLQGPWKDRRVRFDDQNGHNRRAYRLGGWVKIPAASYWADAAATPYIWPDCPTAKKA